jgi:hypothetical protein
LGNIPGLFIKNVPQLDCSIIYRAFSLSAAMQILSFQKGLLTKIEMYGILMAEGKLNTGYMRFNFRALSLTEIAR